MVEFVDISGHGERADACPEHRLHDPDLAEILDDVEGFLRRFVVMSDGAFAVATIWVAHAYAFAAFEFTPYLAITSATKRSGKSRLLEVLEVLLGPNRSVSTANISSASLFRLIDANPGLAVLFDEIDRVSKEKADDLWGLINSGWRLGGKAHRQSGPKMETLAVFSTFSPKVLAGIGQPLPDTVADRSLPIRMERRLPSETVERLRLRTAATEVAPIRAALTDWANQDTINRLAAARPSLPSSMKNDRLADVSEPLLAIADLAGDQWPARIRKAVMALEDVAEQVADEELGILALRHAFDAFAEKSTDRLSTDDVLAYMVTLDDGPWAEWWGDKVENGKTVAPARRLRKLLGRFEDVEPVRLRIDGRPAGVRGYQFEPIRKAAERYLPHPSATSATSATALASTVADVADVADTPGSPDVEPGLRRLQRDVGEVPETDEERALERAKVRVAAEDRRRTPLEEPPGWRMREI